MSRKASTIVATVLVAMLAFAAIPGIAAAAPVTDWSMLSVGYLGNGTSPVLIVAGELPAGTKLPAQIEVAVPQGSTIAWFGELSGSEGNVDDVASKYSLTRTENGYDIYTATLTKYLKFQIEAENGTFFTADADGHMAASLKYVPICNATMALIGAEIPTGFAPSTAGPTALGTGISGGTVYGTTSNNVKAGDVMSLDIAYAASAATPATGSAGSTSSSPIKTILIVLAVAVTVVVVVLVGVLMARRMGAATEEDE